MKLALSDPDGGTWTCMHYFVEERQAIWSARSADSGHVERTQLRGSPAMSGPDAASSRGVDVHRKRR